MTEKSASIRKTIEKTYREKRRKSEAFFRRGQEVFTGGMPRNLQFHNPFPFIIERGEGTRVFDLDGNEYIDFCCNFSSLILGHAHPKVLKAIEQAIPGGTVHSNPTPLQYELAELLCDRIPSVEQIRFLNSGTEAGMWIVRLARAFTGKDKILKMEGGYHGMADALDISIHPSPKDAGGPSNPLSVPDDHGIPAGVIRDTVVAPFNDKEITREIFENNADELAAVIVEPMLGAGGEIPAQGDYLEFLRDITAERGVLLIFDEVISLRLAYGGAQERFNIIPDLCMMGKIIGGGLPAGAFGGRKDIMALLSPVNNYVSHSGTFSANSATMAAGLATMKELTYDVYERLELKGDRLRKESNAVFKDLGIKGQVTGIGSCFQVHFTDQHITNYRDVAVLKDDILVPSLLNLCLLNRGIYLSKKASGFISAVHTEPEIDTFLNALSESLEEIRPVIETEAPELIYS